MNTTASNARLHKMVGCALFAALTAVCSQLAIPMPWGVPINLALFAVYMAGTMLGPVWGAASQLVYLLLAAVGVPVMAGMQGGPAVLLGKTGGYAIGYLLAALIAGTFAAKLPRKFGWLALGCVVGCAACYVLGTIWFMVLTGLDLPTSLTYCVIPYLPGVSQCAAFLRQWPLCQKPHHDGCAGKCLQGYPDAGQIPRRHPAR